MSTLIIQKDAGLIRAFGPDYWRCVKNEVQRDRIIYLIVLVHAIGAGVLGLSLGRPEKIVYFEYGAIWIRSVATIASLYIVLFELPASIRSDPAAPLARLRQRIPDLLHPRAAAAVGLVLCVVLLKGSFTSVKNMLPDIGPFGWDEPLAQTDAWLHGGRDPWRLLQPLLGHQPITRAIQLLYAAGWMFAVCGVPAVVAASRRLSSLRVRFFLTYLFCWIVLGNLLAGIFMSAGPVYFGEVTGDMARYGDQIQYLSFSTGALHSSFDIQRGLWSLHLLDRVELGSGISAFPSLHVAMATLFFLLGCSINRMAGWIGAAFLLVIMAGSVHLAWHYAIDGYVSFLLTVAVWSTIEAIERRRDGSGEQLS